MVNIENVMQNIEPANKHDTNMIVCTYIMFCMKRDNMYEIETEMKLLK